MPLIELSLEQILEAVIQLPRQQRDQLVADIQKFPQGEQAREAFADLRSKFTMPAKKQQRISLLQSKANEGTLTAKEQADLDQLVVECEQRTLDLAHAVARSGHGKATRQQTG
jgi:hypothetical protein